MHVSRRNFVKASAAIPFLPSLSYSRILGSNERLNVAFIGTGGMGTAHASNLAKVSVSQYRHWPLLARTPCANKDKKVEDCNCRVSI